MSWLPPINKVLILIKHIEADEDPLLHSSELFWLFYTQSVTQEEYITRIAWFKDYHAKQKQIGGGFTDPDVEALMLQAFDNPEKAANIIVDRLDVLSEMKRVPYIPDQKDDPVRLYLYIHIEASRLARLLKLEGYSEKTREVLDNAINAFNRCNNATGTCSNAPWAEEYSISLQALGAFLHITKFSIQKSDGDYEYALKSLALCFTLNLMASLLFPEGRTLHSNPFSMMSVLQKASDTWESVPWMKALDPQGPVDCFEAIRAGSSIKDFKNLAGICSLIITIANSWWPSEEQASEVKDAKGESWNYIDYWQHALGWVEAQLQPSELRELLSEREDQAAEQRLRVYFFGDELWAKLPERARSSLISADRDWFGGALARTEAVLNELKIATEELMLNGLWKPFEQWFGVRDNKRRDMQDFLKLKVELAEKRRLPTILDLERICRMSVTGFFLVEKGVSLKERQWFIKELPRSLYHLRKARNRAEHESIGNWAHQELTGFVAEFIGIGRPGVLPQLAKVLFQEKYSRPEKSP